VNRGVVVVVVVGGEGGGGGGLAIGVVVGVIGCLTPNKLIKLITQLFFFSTHNYNSSCQLTAHHDTVTPTNGLIVHFFKKLSIFLILLLLLTCTIYYILIIILL
jgi:hypothetical protein